MTRSQNPLRLSSADVDFGCRRPLKSVKMALATLGTYTGGRERRIDFIGLPLRWTPSRAWISTIIDPSSTRTDHLAACVDVEFQGQLHRHRSQPRRSVLKFDNAHDYELGGPVPHLDPGLHVHTHAPELQRFLLDAVASHAAPHVPRPRKETMSAETWDLVLEKRAARKRSIWQH
jgi:hypothetical protein